jgi:hypothetical protein
MDAVVFAFVVIPVWFCFIGAVFSVVFGGDILRWYTNQLAAQRATKKLNIAVEPREHREYAEPAPRKRERETVGV